MKLIRLACAVGMVLVSGGCAEQLTAPQQASVRTTSSPAPRAEPLFVVDGKIVDGGVAIDINPNRIENVEVLKGAAAVERYGSRGVNGVVLITLKQAS
ncbi:MAG TPA: TonB-dependent receptor plug domain-containing protein [Longimicrobiaceae bacterium]|nr:TonB-dependent receptor plug domain-containing protein [Longimicrobiaceae bacterium]